VQSPDARIAIESYIAIEDEAARVSGDPYFGLHMCEYFEPGNWSILGYMMMNCKTLGEAFEKAGRYTNIIGNLIRGSIHIGFKGVKLVLAIPKYASKHSRHCFEDTLSSSIRLARTLSGQKINPLEAGFSYPAPESTAEYRRVFCSPVLFKQKHTYMVVDPRIANIPVLLPNPSLLEHFETYARQYLLEIEGTDKTTQEVIRHILGRLDGKNLTIGSVAREMSVSVRTLQNRLKSEGTVFSELLEETRERLAKKYLRQNYTVDDITYLLGFAEASVFRKAFKKWSGTTPKEYRETATSKN
jgi:AraC-like DNA-binding protein